MVPAVISLSFIHIQAFLKQNLIVAIVSIQLTLMLALRALYVANKDVWFSSAAASNSIAPMRDDLVSRQSPDDSWQLVK